MNIALNSIGLQPMQADKRTNPYADLIRRLHEEKKNQLNRDELKEILTKENLWVTTTTQDIKGDYTIGVRTFLRGTDTIEFETDKYLCLLHHFNGRYVHEESLWQSDIVPALQALADHALLQAKPLIIHLDTHLSAAFTMGYLLDGKTGVDIAVVQKVRNGGRLLFRPDGATSNEEPRWQFAEQQIDASGNDIAIAFSVTHDISKDVKEFVEKNLPSTSRILNASIQPKPSGAAIQDGNHIIQAIEEFITYLRSWRTGTEKLGKVHLFIAAPNAFAFFLGRYSKILGKTVLYEYDFDNLRTGSYVPAISLPFKNS